MPACSMPPTRSSCRCPDFTINADDQTLAHYPLTFNLADSKPTIVLGDADSTSPLDIDAIEGGVPVSAAHDQGRCARRRSATCAPAGAVTD